MNKLKLIGLTFVMLFSTTALAQEKSEIVMTQSELESFLNKVADARRAQLKARNEAKNKRELAELRYQYNNQTDGRDATREISNYEILREIDRLNARLDLVTGRSNDGFIAGRQGSNSTIVVPGGSNTTGYVPTQGQTQYVPVNTANTQDLETAKAIWELERRLDSLKSAQVQSNLVPQDKPVNQQQTPSQELADLKSQFQSLEQRLENAETPLERRSLLEELLAKFKNFKKQVFFANNSEELSPNDFAYIQDVTEVLMQYPELSVVLEGWASTRGNADYNKQLSMRRAESVERALLSNGISPARIVSSFRGEDKTSSEAMARRVDMSIILK